MTIGTRARSALLVTFLVYAIESVIAALVSVPWAVELSQRIPPRPFQDLDGALLLESLDALTAIARGSLSSLALAATLVLLLAPWLHMAWLSALHTPAALAESLTHGFLLIPRALLVSLWVLGCALLPVALLGGLGYVVHVQLIEDARHHDLALLGVLAGLSLLAFLAATVHDLARASALSQPASRALRAGLRGLTPRILMTSFGCAGASLALFAVGQLAASSMPDGSLMQALGLVLLQISLLARRFVRSLWLACAVARVAPGAPLPAMREEVA